MTVASSEPTAAATDSELVGSAVEVVTAEQRLLGPASFSLRTGELVAVIGPSGSGKTTLLRALAGVTALGAGSVTLDSEPIASRARDVGFLPERGTVHDLLTVREALEYTVALRRPDLGSVDSGHIDEVIAELNLSQRADAQLAELSRGERKRAEVAVELIVDPEMLLLDEPGTGLDPGLNRRLMRTLRSIADRGRGVCLITHETGSLGLCDRVVVMAPGGSIAFDGPPEEAPEFFEVDDLDAIYEQLEPASEAPEAGTYEQTRLERAPLALDQPFGRQTLILADRDRKLLFRSSRTLALTLAQAPIIGLLIGLVLPTDVLSNPALAGFNGVLISFMLLIGAIFMGVNATARTIIGELGILERETAAGVRTDAYIAAKALVAFPLIVVQTVVLFAVTVFLQPLNSPPDVYTQVLVLVILAGIAAAAMGLAVSARVRTTSQAAASVPLLLIPQLLFAGAIVPVAVMPPVVNLIPNLMIARWGLAGIGEALGLSNGVSGDVSSVAGYDPQFFVTPSGISVVVLAGATIIAQSIAAGGLNRKLVG